MDSPLLIAGVLTWLAALGELRAVIRHPTVVVTNYWLALLSLSLAIILRVPIISGWIDQLADVPHVSRVLSNAGAVLTLFFVQNAVYAIVAPRRMRRLRLLAMASTGTTLLLMALLFIRAAPLEPGLDAWQSYAVNQMAAYKVAFLTYMAGAFTIVASIWGRYAFLSQTLQLRAAFALMAAGGWVGTLYALNGLGVVLRALGAERIAGWSRPEASDSLVALAIVLVLLGTTIQRWLGITDLLCQHWAFLRLRPLWRNLTEVCPGVTLLPKRRFWRDLFEVRGANFRLRRQITEITHALLLLRRRTHQEARDSAARIAIHFGMDAQEQQALTEAVLLWTAIHANGRSASPENDGPPEAARSSLSRSDQEAKDLWAEVRYLTRVAHHIQGSEPLRRALDTIPGIARARQENNFGTPPVSGKRRYP